MAAELRFAAIADDYTGASDLAGMLHAERVSTVRSSAFPAPPHSSNSPPERKPLWLR